MSNAITHPFSGATAAVFSVITSFQYDLDWTVRFCGSVVFLFISILSAIRAVRDFNKPSK